MKIQLSPDCVRDILLAVEQMEYGRMIPISKLRSALKGYSEDEIAYHCLKLSEAGFLVVYQPDIDGVRLPTHVEDITYDGHQFLATVRPDTVWQSTKQAAVKVGVFSIKTLFDIAVGISGDLIKGMLH